MKISIVVPAFNEEKLIARSLESIRNSCEVFTKRGWDFEIIVCDNNSTDRTSELAKAAGAIVVFEPINQIGRARNCGAAAATGDWLLFVDADSFPSHNLFDDAAAAMMRGDVAAGGAVVRMDSSDWGLEFMTWVWNQISKNRKWMAGSFIFCETRAFREIGGFSPNLYISEELDLSKRLKQWARANGKKVLILTKHPLVTSARKGKLYSKMEIVRFLGRVVFSGGKSMRDPKLCGIWYDGRR